jgi:hypothetical protein
MRESRFAKGGQPFAWGIGGCAPDHPSLSPAAAGSKNTFATALGLFARTLDYIVEFAYYKHEGRESNHAARFPGGEPQL